MRNANRSPKPLFCNGENNGKVIQNPYPGLDQQQKLTSSFNWWTQSQYQVSMKSAHYCFSKPNPAHRMTDRLT